MKISLSDHFTYPNLLRFTLPSIAMMVFTSIYGVVDGFFVSNYVGKTAFASINLVMPFVMILGGMGFMIGTGGTALVSKSLGEGKEREANRYFSMVVYLTLAMGAVLSAVGVIFMRPVAYFLGATEEMISDCVLYGRIVTGFTVTFMLQNVFQSLLIAAEKPRLGLAATLVAGFTNMILDWLLIGVFGWGVVGAAIATGLSQTVGGVLPLMYFLRQNDSRLRLVPTNIELQPMLKACGNGSSELMSSISSSVVGMIYNYQLLRYIGEDGLSAFGVLMYVQFIFVGIFVGYSIGCAPIIGFHYGAENAPELHNMLKKSLILMGGGGVVLSALAYLCSGILAKIFVGYDADLCALTVHAFRIYSFAFLLSGTNIFVSSFFTALNNGAVSAAISFLRTLVLQTSTVIILPLLFDIDGIWLAMTASEVCAFAVSLAFLFGKRKRYGYI